MLCRLLSVATDFVSAKRNAEFLRTGWIGSTNPLPFSETSLPFSQLSLLSLEKEFVCSCFDPNFLCGNFLRSPRLPLLLLCADVITGICLCPLSLLPTSLPLSDGLLPEHDLPLNGVKWSLPSEPRLPRLCHRLVLVSRLPLTSGASESSEISEESESEAWDSRNSRMLLSRDRSCSSNSTSCLLKEFCEGKDQDSL